MRINQRIPNFRNLSIHLRVLVLICVGLLLVTLANTEAQNNIHTFINILATLCVTAVPTLFLSLLSLYAFYPMLMRWPYRHGMFAVFVTTISLSLFNTWLQYQWMTPFVNPSWFKTTFMTASLTALSLYYLNLLQRAYSPAIAEARLQALQARIRPHFLFNSLNAVLSLIRSQPKVAETALEDMADLFRVLMADNRDLVPLAQEIGLCRQYLSIEKLRLDERLQCRWELSQMPPDILIPPLILQPLIENAVYHGIEPLPTGGEILIQITQQQNTLHIHISNPLPQAQARSTGNKFALKNIQERLLLHYDLEARLVQKTELVKSEQQQDQQRYVVNIDLPIIKQH